MYNDVRKCAEVHREVRRYIRTIAKPGVRLFDLCETLEDSVRKLIEEKGLQVRCIWGCLAMRDAHATVCFGRSVWRPHIESLACQLMAVIISAQARLEEGSLWERQANRICVARGAPSRGSVRMRQPHIITGTHPPSQPGLLSRSIRCCQHNMLTLAPCVHTGGRRVPHRLLPQLRRRALDAQRGAPTRSVASASCISVLINPFSFLLGR